MRTSINLFLVLMTLIGIRPHPVLASLGEGGPCPIEDYCPPDPPPDPPPPPPGEPPVPPPQPAPNPNPPPGDNGQPGVGLIIPPAVCTDPGCNPLPRAASSAPVVGITSVPPITPTAANGGRIVGEHMSMSIVNPSYADIPIMNSNIRTTQNNFAVKITAACFPTNLRAVANPVAVNGRIQMRGLYSIESLALQNKRFYVEFPARSVMLEGYSTQNYPITVGNPLPPIVPPVVKSMPKTFTEFFAKFKNDFSQRSKKTLFAILPRQALALMPFCEYDCEPGGGGGAPGGGVGGTGGGDLNPLSTPLNPLDPMAYHMWFEELPAPATLQGGISQRQVLINLPGVSTTTIYGTTDTTTATNQFGISNLSFIQEVPRPTAADLQQLTSYQNYQISALTYRASFGQPYWISYEDWRRQIYSNSYMGVTGPIGVPTNAGPQPSISINQSPDGRTFEIFASLPGEISMCGGFFSPLMVFFDKKYPSFENITDFKMMHEFKTYWPEASHAGYFIGMLNKNNKIESYTDLFGEDMNVRNGFEKLAQYDANKDGKIDARDPIFKKLVLWKDKKGQGIFNKKDIIALSQKIKSINLKYKNEFEMISLGAEFRQRASFTFISKGKLKNGEVIDVWLKPYHADQNRSVAQSKHEAQ